MGMLSDPKIWVAFSFLLFVALTYKKIAGFIIRALDARSAQIKAELDQAKTLREEAENVLAQYKQKQAEYLKEAEGIMLKAREDANLFRSNAERELQSVLDTRMKHAIEKIALEENKAIQDVRNHVVDIALAAARAMIVEHVATMSQEELVKLALADLERKIH